MQKRNAGAQDAPVEAYLHGPTGRGVAFEEPEGRARGRTTTPPMPITSYYVHAREREPFGSAASGGALAGLDAWRYRVLDACICKSLWSRG